MITQTQIMEINADLLEGGKNKANSLEEFESLAGEKTRQVMRAILGQWLAACEELDPLPQTLCRECGLKANFVSRRTALIRTQFGLVRYRRAYYVCPHCHAATCPLDERLYPIESLARLRAKIGAGKHLPVGEMAKVWGLGTIRVRTNSPMSLRQDPLYNSRSASSELIKACPTNSQIGLSPII
jgi:hypothetical protein